jgi:hypothetical protein
MPLPEQLAWCSFYRMGKDDTFRLLDSYAAKDHVISF